MIEMMKATGIPDGLCGVGYNLSDVPALTHGAMPQKRLLDNAPKPVSETDVAYIYEHAMQYY